MVMLGLSSGVGAATLYACVNVVPVLIEGMGPGTVFSMSCTTTSIFTLSAITSFIMEWLHMIWNVFGFLLFAQGVIFAAPLLVLSHFGAAYFTLMNREPGLCGGSLIALATILIVDVVSLVLILRSKRLVLPARAAMI